MSALSCANSTFQAPLPGLPELRGKLLAELKRLGKDPSRAVSQAPSGETDAVFDLTAEPVVGQGSSTIDSVALEWTERFIGDYDNNGEVGLADITPLGMHFKQGITYDSPAQHAGLAYWPAGDALTDPGQNWQLARIDGDANGQMTLADITPIAVHWGERIDGYRVYRRLAGKAEWELVPNGSPSYTVARPVANAAGITRYTWLDRPPGAGTYEYAVAAFCSGGNGESSSEATIFSNVATATLTAQFTDDLAPIWDGTVGISDAVVNADNTVTIHFGTATDVAPVSVAPHPPVSYSVYWSLSNPIAFGTAARAADVVSGWTSPPLLAGTTYHFAVRAADSSSPQNTDTNDVEQTVTMGGQATVDADPPVWVEPSGRFAGKPIEGIREVQPLAGILRITHAVAEDTLSPPVHYDLYYISDEVAASVLQDSSTAVRADAQVVRDIDPTYDLVWPNREAAHLLVRARDSATQANTETNTKELTAAPGNYLRRVLDANIPGIHPGTTRVWGDKAVDGRNQRAYFCYTTSGSDPQDQQELWFLKLDLATAVWQSKLLYVASGSSKIDPNPKVAISRTGDVWVRGAVAQDADSTFYKVLRSNGSWEDWDATAPPYAWYNKIFDHNGNPLTFELQPSDFQQNRKKAIYRWWDEARHAWQEETACDPGTTQCYTFTRPDGTLQALVDGEAGAGADGVPEKARLLERSVDGTWSVVNAQTGSLRTTMDEAAATWGQEVAWWGPGLLNSVPQHLVYGTGGYRYLDPPLWQGTAISGRYWPAGDGHYHLLPNYLWRNSEYFKQSFASTDYDETLTQSRLFDLLEAEFRSSPIYNPLTGTYGLIEVEADSTAHQYRWLVLASPAGGSILVTQ